MTEKHEHILIVSNSNYQNYFFKLLWLSILYVSRVNEEKVKPSGEPVLGLVTKELIELSKEFGFHPEGGERCDHSSRVRHPGMWSQVGLRKHHYEQS